MSLWSRSALIGVAVFVWTTDDSYAATQQPRLAETVQTHCVGCHNDRAMTGSLSLEGADPADVAGNTATWEKVVRKLRAGAMPPAGAARPDDAVYEGLLAHLESELDRLASDHPDPVDQR